MLVGVCEKCKFTDLLENPEGICPRCGAKIVSLGIDTAQWNAMSYPEKMSLVDEGYRKFAGETAEDVAEETTGETVEEPVQEKEAPPLPVQEPPVKTEDHETEDSFSRIREQKQANVYVCYKCDKVVSHDDGAPRYYCPECGSDMLWTGFTAEEWGLLSIRAKHNATQNAKIRYIESEIKKTEFKG